MGSQEERRRQRGARAVNLSMFIVWGVALGTLVFAMTGEALWVAIGPSLGVLVGALWQINQRARDIHS